MAIKFVVHQDPATRRWHWRLRSAANDRDWAVSSAKGYTRREAAVAGCKLLWTKLAGFSQCPRIQVNSPTVPALVEALAKPVSKCPFCTTTRDPKKIGDDWRCANCARGFSRCKECGCPVALFEKVCGECACEDDGL